MSALPLNLNNTLGALLIGVVLSASLYGVTCTQVFFYFQNYGSSDGISVRGTVTLLWILETLHLALAVHAIYTYTVLDYFNPSALAVPTWSSSLNVGISGGIIFVVHLFYARRVFYISRRNIPLVGVILALALATIGTTITTTVTGWNVKNWADLNFKTFGGVAVTALSLGLAADIIIAASLSFYLHTSRSGFEGSDTLVNRLMVYAINNVLLTSIFVIIDLILVVTEIHNLIFLGVNQVVGNLYTNSMLATVNSRQSLRRSGRPIVTGLVQPLRTFSTTMPEENDNAEYNTDSKPIVQITSTREVHVV